MEVNIKNFKVQDGYSMEDIGRQIYVYLQQDKQEDNIIPMIVVTDGSKIKIINDARDLPTNWKYETKRTYSDVIEYYLRNQTNDTLYCIYGTDAILKIYPSIIYYCDVAKKMSQNDNNNSDEQINSPYIIVNKINDNKSLTEIVKYSTTIVEPVSYKDLL